MRDFWLVYGIGSVTCGRERSTKASGDLRPGGKPLPSTWLYRVDDDYGLPFVLPRKPTDHVRTPTSTSIHPTPTSNVPFPALIRHPTSQTRSDRWATKEIRIGLVCILRAKERFTLLRAMSPLDHPLHSSQSDPNSIIRPLRVSQSDRWVIQRWILPSRERCNPCGTSSHISGLYRTG